ncbi:MAG: sugar phosphate nucleotidyltransferase, partial [Desulfurococcaceae archaeon]
FNGKVRFVYQEEPRGTGDAAIKASEVVGPGEDVIILYSDIFLDDWSTLSIVGNTESHAIVGVIHERPQDYGVILTRGSRLDRVVEKPSAPTSNIINAGIYRLNTSDILENRTVPVSPRGEIELTDIINRIASEKPITVITHTSRWIDIGKPWHVIEANKVALSKINRAIKGILNEPVNIKGNVYVDERSILHPFTSVEGPAYIGPGVEIGPSAYIRPWSVICDGSKIGFSAEVKESILLENIHVHHLAYIGDSIICEGVNLGAGTVLANLRFDEKPVKMTIKGALEDTGRRKMGAVIGAGVKTGINVSIMPGVKIGSYSWIMPGTVVYRDVPSNTIYPPKAIVR